MLFIEKESEHRVIFLISLHYAKYTMHMNESKNMKLKAFLGFLDIHLLLVS